MTQRDNHYLPEHLRRAAKLIHESLIHGEDFDDFLLRPPSSQDDLEIWQALDLRLGNEISWIRKRYLEAGVARRCQQTSLESYLQMLETSGHHSRSELTKIVGVCDETWTSWVLAEGDAILSSQQLEQLVAGASLCPREATHLRKLRHDAVEDAISPLRQPGLAEYLRREPGSLRHALAHIRARKGMSVDQVAAQAGLAASVWKRWEEGQEKPPLPALDGALKKLYWIWATDDALRGWKDEVPAPADVRLWKAFLNDHEWEETGAQEDWLLPKRPTPEAVEAWKQVELANERKRAFDPQAEALKVLAEERLRAESTVGGFLRFRRETKGATVEEMASKAGVEVKTWLAWEADQVVPALPEVEALGPRIFVTPWLRERLVEIWRQMAGGEKSMTSA